MASHGFRLRHAFVAFGLTFLGLAGQFLVRMAMTSSLGAGAEYEAFLIAMIPAVLIATVGFQAMASALTPRLSDMITARQTPAALRLYQRISVATFGFWSVIGIGAIVWSAVASSEKSRYGASLVVVVTAVILGWGLISGWNVLQRQMLNYFGHFAIPGMAGLLPPFLMAGWAWFRGKPSVMDFTFSGLVGILLCSGWMSWGLSRAWKHAVRETPPPAPNSEPSPNTAPELGFRVLGLSALPIFLASFNAQLMTIVDQAMAAWWQVGGLVLLSAALAISRLPQTLAENVMMSTSYGHMVKAVSAVQVTPSDETRKRLAQVYRHLVGLQSLVVLPAAGFILIFHGPIVEVLYQRGKFGPEDAAKTAAILAAFPLCAPGLMLQSVQVPILVALGRASVALRYEIGLTILSALLNLVFLPIFGLPGLVVSTGLAVLAVGLLILGALVRLNLGIGIKDFVWALRRPALALVISMIAGYAFYWLLPRFSGPIGGAFGRVLIGGGAMACIFYGLTLVNYPPLGLYRVSTMKLDSH